MMTEVSTEPLWLLGCKECASYVRFKGCKHNYKSPRTLKQAQALPLERICPHKEDTSNLIEAAYAARVRRAFEELQSGFQRGK